MYRLNDIVEAFKGLVGWERENSSISEASVASESGLYFQEAHPLLTLRALRGIMPDDYIGRYEEYSPLKIYAKGDIATKNGQAFISLEDDNEEAPPSSSWEDYDILESYLDELETRGIKKVVTRFVRDKVIGMESKNIIDRRCLFDGTGNINARVPNASKVVGFEITPLRTQGITMKLEKIGLQFVGNSGDVTLYLFHSSKMEPVWTKTVNFSNSRGTFMWFDLNEAFLPYVNDSVNAGGSWFLVYDQKSLPPYMEAINFGRDWSREPCGSCNKGDAILWGLMSRFVQVSPFYVADPSWDGSLWDMGEMMYDVTNNYGINLMFSIGCDVSDTMIAERLDFANVIQLQVASDALRTIALNPEVSVNRVQYNADRDNILYETDGNGQGIRGLHGDLERAYKALSFDTRGLDDMCLTCKAKGIRYGSI